MPKQELIIPTLDKNGFTCPICNFNAKQDWGTHYFFGRSGSGLFGEDYEKEKIINYAKCQHCYKYSLWYNSKMIYPESILVAEPNEDMPEDIKEDYLEAASILQKSPRASAALLRLSIQKLCESLGKTGKIDSMIKDLVQDGLPKQVQQALDVVRVIGNEGVHPGQMDLKDDHETVLELFKLVNFICEKMISEPKYIETNFNSLPQSKLDAIQQRDKSP